MSFSQILLEIFPLLINVLLTNYGTTIMEVN